MSTHSSVNKMRERTLRNVILHFHECFRLNKPISAVAVEIHNLRLRNLDGVPKLETISS